MVNTMKIKLYVATNEYGSPYNDCGATTEEDAKKAAERVWGKPWSELLKAGACLAVIEAEPIYVDGWRKGK
jgi:hypothetical protein